MTKKARKKDGIKKEDQGIRKAYEHYVNGYNYVATGKYQKAIDELKQAEPVFRKLIASGQHQYREELATLVMNLGNAFAELNHPEDALTYNQEAINIFQKLVNIGQVRFQSNLAIAIMNTGITIRQLGRIEDALNYYQRSANIYEKLIVIGEENYRPNLANLLIGIGSCLAELKSYKDAWNYYEKAIEQYEHLISIGNTSHYQDLAGAFCNVGNVFHHLGHYEKVLDYSIKAVNIYQELVTNGRIEYQPNLAHALVHQGSALCELNRPEETLVCSEKALKIYQDLVNSGQKNHQAAQAHTLFNMGVAFAELKHPNEAMNCYQVAAKIYQNLVTNGQTHYQLFLADTLVGMGNACIIYNPKGGLANYQQAIDLYQKWIAAGQTQYLPNLALALMNKGATLSRLNSNAEALLYQHQAADLYRKLIAAGHLHHQLMLIYSLINMADVQKKMGDINGIASTISEILNAWMLNKTGPAILNSAPTLAQLIDYKRNVDGFATHAKRLAECLSHTLSDISPQHLAYFYPLAEGAFTGLLIAAMDRKTWDLALSLVGTARAQRLVKLAQADLLNRAAQADAPAELCKYREVYQRFAELEILLNVESGYDQGAFTIGRASNADKADQYATLHAEYTDLRRQLDSLQQALQQQGLLPDLGNDLFDGAALRNQLSQDKVLMILFDHGVGDNKKSTGVLLLTRESGQVLTINALPDLAEHLKRLTTKISSRGRGLRDGPQTREMVDDARMESGADLGSVDAETETLVQRLSEEFWKPIHDALGKMTKADGDHRRRWTFWKSTGQKPMNPQAGMVWLIPTGSLHGLPWQASAPPGLCCRVVPAPWFVREALNRLKSPIAIPTAENPLGILAYDAKTVIERQHGTEEKELFHLALEQTLIQAVWGEAVHPLTGLNASHPPAAFVVLAGHGANDADIPGAARVWVGRQDDGERRYVGFGDLWRTPLNLQSIYLSSCVVGMTREVNGEPMGLLSAGLLRGARYLVGWTVPVDDLGVALFSLLYHWAWREHQDPETALVVARQVFLSGDWPEETLALARQHLGVHIKGIMSRYLEIPASRTTTKRRLREVLEDLASLAAESAEPFIKILDQWRQLGIRSSTDELQLQAYRLADRLIVRRRELSFRYLAYFALGCG